jgi:hypothetical protein
MNNVDLNEARIPPFGARVVLMPIKTDPAQIWVSCARWAAARWLFAWPGAFPGLTRRLLVGLEA